MNRRSGFTLIEILVVVAIIAVLFVVLNSEKTEMNLIFAKPNLPLFVLVITSMLIGFLLAKLTGRRKKDD